MIHHYILVGGEFGLDFDAAPLQRRAEIFKRLADDFGGYAVDRLESQRVALALRKGQD